jgi:3'-5' exoribonuclease
MTLKKEIKKSDKGPWVNDLQLGMEFIGFYIVRNPRLDPFRDPSRGKYLRMQLVDRTGIIEARMWEGAEKIFEEVNGGGPVKVAGVVERFREEFQVYVGRMRAARDGEVEIADMMRATERDVGKMWEFVQEAVNSIHDPHLSALVRHFYTDSDWITRFMEAPSARRVHHSYYNGFLEHTYELLVLAQPLMTLYPEIDRDLLVTGILLHDIGKLEELSWGFDTDYTDKGRLLGHIILGERSISRAIETIEGFPKDRALEVLHLVVSHHGRYEWGSPRRPKSIEAVALHYLDNLDAQVNRFKLLTEDTRGNGESWTSYDRMLRRSLYAGNGSDLSVEENGIVE